MVENPIASTMLCTILWLRGGESFDGRDLPCAARIFRCTLGRPLGIKGRRGREEGPRRGADGPMKAEDDSGEDAMPRVRRMQLIELILTALGFQKCRVLGKVKICT